MSYRRWRRRSLRLRRRCRPRRHSPLGLPSNWRCPQGRSVSLAQRWEGVLKLWPRWSAGGGGSQYPSKGGGRQYCDTPIKIIRANNILKYQSLDQSLVQYIIQVVHSHTTLLFKYKTLQHDDDTN
jgi:hypothetical protein